MYSQIALGYDASNAGLYLLIFFGGFAAASQLGGRLLDARGARIPVVVGCLVGAVGFFLWAQQLTDLNLDAQWPWIVVAGIGIGLILSPVSTDALNRASQTAYGEVTGITQTVRNFGSSLGLAVLGTILILRNKANIEETLGEAGAPKAVADRVAEALSGTGGGDAAAFAQGAGDHAHLFEAVQHDFAASTQTVFYVMAGIMAVAFVVALIGMPRGVAPQVQAARDDDAQAARPGAAA